MMKIKTIPYIIILIISINCIYAEDLSDYPDLFIDDSIFDGIVVAGKAGSAMDVVVMTSIITDLSSRLDSQQLGKTKLDIEVDDIYETNIISVGSPCNNDVTYEILGKSNSCESYLKQGISYLKLLNKEGLYQLLVIAPDDDGMRELGNIFLDFDKYDIDSDYYEVVYKETIFSDDDNSIGNEESSYEEQITEEKEEYNSENEMTDNSEQDDNNNHGSGSQNKEEKSEEEDVKKENIKEEDDSIKKQNIFIRFFSWIAGLFGK